jgi:hypothetical protein
MTGGTDMLDRGLELLRTGSLTAEEASEFRGSYERSHAGLPAAYEFWLEFDAPVVKSHRLWAFHTSTEEHRAMPLHGTLGFLHLYTVLGYEAGIRYEVAHSRSLGAPKAVVLQVFELAFIHCGPRGIDRARAAAADLLRDWQEPDQEMVFPAHWQRDPELFALDLDLGTSDLTPGEERTVRSWYERNAGEVPGWVEYLLSVRPGLIKAYHNRLARAMTGPLPAQLLPFLLLQFHVSRVDGIGMREAYRLGTGLGMTADELAEAVGWGSMYGGMSACSTLMAVAGDLITSEDREER